MFDFRAVRHGGNDFLRLARRGQGRFARWCGQGFESVALCDVEHIIKPHHGDFLFLAGLLVLAFKLFPEYHGASFFALADMSAKLQRLPECQPVGRFVVHGMEQQNIDATIKLFGDKVARQTGLRFPRLAPRDGAFFQ